jgi:hypothetical protein
VAGCAFLEGDEEFDRVWKDVGGERGGIYARGGEVGEGVGAVDWIGEDGEVRLNTV